MELISSSEDEGDLPTSFVASPVPRKPPQSPSSQDSIEELLSPTKRVQMASQDRPRPPPVAKAHKPVVSTRELLMNLLPSSKRRQQAKSSKDATEKAVDAAVAAYSSIGNHKKYTPSPSAEKELTAGERIARKYGLAAANTSSMDSRKRDLSASTVSRATAKRTVSSDDHVEERKIATSPKVVEKSKKRRFWDTQTTGVDSEQVSASKSTYVSPFSTADGFMDVKRRQQRRQQPVQEMTEEEMKTARDTFYDDAKTAAQDVGSRPRHIIGSAIPGVDDADGWMSDAKEITSDDDETLKKQEQPTFKRTSASGGRRMPREKRESAKRQPRKRVQELSDSSEDEKEIYTSERWPQLDPPKVNTGPMLLSSEVEGSNTLEVCANMNSYLFDYQRVGVEFLFGAYMSDTGAILGDDMGLGKTIQVIAFLSAIMGKHGD
ncbi:hypothetical protein V7S43_001798 [Phytophthora oleae]|uniref:SNF2 N-terminal domain-containing protein n=1 Tax=Phytophthora oleae TaxID=2107226 RepID=A0ABD3G016_9STRA